MVKSVNKALIVLIFIGQFLCQGIIIPGINIPVYLGFMVLLGGVMLLSLTKSLDRKIETLDMVIWLLFIDILLVSLINLRIDAGRLMLIFFSFLFMYAIKRLAKDRENIKKIYIVYIIIILISSLVAIAQFMGMGWSVALWNVFHSSTKIEGALMDKRFLGLAPDILQFGYHSSTAFIITLFMKFEKKKWLKPILIAIFGFAIIINNTRSAWIATVVAILIYLITRKNRRTTKAIAFISFAMILVIVAWIAFASGIFSDTRFSEGDTGTTARVPMLLTALNHFAHYPFGMGIYSVDPNLVVGADASEYSIVIENTAHNLIGNCAAAYGFIGLALLIALYVLAFKNYKLTKIKLAGDNNEYLIAMVCLIGLIINAFFHNNYILNGELSSFVFFGVLFAFPAYLREKENNKTT